MAKKKKAPKGEPMKWYGSFSSGLDVELAFFPRWASDDLPDRYPTDEEILFASRSQGGAYVLFQLDGALYEVEVRGTDPDRRCFRGEWRPKRTSWETLAVRSLVGDYLGGFPGTALAAAGLQDLIRRHL